MAYDPKQLLLQAFMLARNSGRARWECMTIAVLKNRMLLLSRGEFEERKHGAATFRQFLAGQGDLVTLDDSVSPALVTLLDPSSMPSESPSSARREEEGNERHHRVREDLWRAIMDFSSGAHYVWDAATQVARKSDNPSDSNPLPTVSRDDLWAWRREFAEKVQAAINESDRARLSRWTSEAVSDRALPPVLIGPWNAEVKSRILARLGKWFTERNLPPPPDILQIDGPSATQSETDRLRHAVIECVKQMTAAELAEFRIPARVVARLLADGHRGS